ncbi:hypothetical protein SASPL_144321 [Salvia splendens]|uniref:Uncharacterized protein n=1 Tax=Salvia splendens TaxID=180675 RepID=A0A8X8Z751_SALSN|nr:hypothetical protein SASPL_144321 [Salvia splendens]
MMSINHPSPPLPLRLRLHLTTTAALPCIILAATAPPAGKLSVLLQTGGVCLVAYWVANFVVPGIVLKDFQSKEKEENSSEDES